MNVKKKHEQAQEEHKQINQKNDLPISIPTSVGAKEITHDYSEYIEQLNKSENESNEDKEKSYSRFISLVIFIPVMLLSGWILLWSGDMFNCYDCDHTKAYIFIGVALIFFLISAYNVYDILFKSKK